MGKYNREFMLQLLRLWAHEAMESRIIPSGSLVDYSPGSKTKGTTFSAWYSPPVDQAGDYLRRQHGLDFTGVYSAREAEMIIRAATNSLYASREASK